MAINRRPPPLDPAGSTLAEDAFIKGAPDAKAKAKPDYEKGVMKGNKRQITLTIAPELLRKVDEVAQRTGQTRAAVINLAIFQSIEGNIFNR